MIDRSRLPKAPLMTPKDWVATFIAVLALATSVYSGMATRTYNRLASRPHLEIISMFATSSSRLGLELANLGPGIGIVDDFRLSLDGTPLTGNGREQWGQFNEATGTGDWTNRGWFVKGQTVAANPSGDADILLIVDERKFSPNNPEEWAKQRDRLREAVKHLTVTIQYHSMYGEAFEIQADGLGIEPPRLRRRNWLGRFVEWQP
jgi:hypothetical protein